MPKSNAKLNPYHSARGLINYSSSEARRIAGHGTQDIEALLGHVDSAELIHRDNLVLL